MLVMPIVTLIVTVSLHGQPDKVTAIKVGSLQECGARAADEASKIIPSLRAGSVTFACRASVGDKRAGQ